ncbi:MAG: hypothetical protein H7296_08530 [Bacteroidia bacterium]|nr:hypothetical protein [Bacteroidia bacterium]
MYLLDYFIKVEEGLPPDKRTLKNVSFMKALVGDVSNLHTQLFGTYKTANFSLTQWDGSPINRNQNVRYGKSVFQSLIDNNTSEPTMSSTWLLITDNFLGSDFRLAIRGERLIFEYAINAWFDTVFRQPTQLSDIYTTTNTILSVPVFRVGSSEQESSNVFSNTSSELVINDYNFNSQFNMTIWVPLAFFNSLGATSSLRESIIRNFADKYINAGIIYNCATY